MSSTGPDGSSPYGSSPYGSSSYGSSPYGSQPSADDPYGTRPTGEPQGYGYGQNPYQGYGQVQHQPYLLPMAPAPRTNGLAIASLVTSCSGLVLGVSAPVGVVLGIVALAQIRNDPSYGGRGMALAGIIVGAAITLIGVLLIAVYVVFLVVALGATSY